MELKHRPSKAVCVAPGSRDTDAAAPAGHLLLRLALSALIVAGAVILAVRASRRLR